ncbi:LacI family DNA-binding transcriptional regulator [Mucilaginibacter gotjawali]|uniref:LacI family transcriptional regulator n=1 Tax=Mucilaginibacter gotjawali TaxID=1550579 RepID=A0A839S8V4_9SPHI|nr:LacI family DNA-binding transcriptional regulator [Mucilaginibacter gotjawali]MBB3054561.1 LacI family transcriptional regulator [Mucilaginibacter gotjawali]
MDNINIKILAKKLNISTSTISRAFNGSPDINKDTKERILAFAKEHNFLPNHYASNLRDKKSRTLAVIVPEIANDFFAQAINGIEEIARKKGFYILLYRTDDVFEKEVSFINYLNNGKVDGIIMSVSGEANDHNYLRQLEQKNIPVVFFDRVYEDIEAAKVITNDYDSSFAATEHLIDTGCKRIAYLVVNKSISIGKVRMQGYIDALQKHGIPFNDELVIDCSNDEKVNYGILKKVLEELKPDGIFSSVERLAFATYYVCHDLNIDIPRDLKVISFSSLHIAPLLNPPLSTITQPAFELGSKAASLLFDELESKGLPIQKKQHVLKSKLYIRKSSGG